MSGARSKPCVVVSTVTCSFAHPISEADAGYSCIIHSESCAYPYGAGGNHGQLGTCMVAVVINRALNAIPQEDNTQDFEDDAEAADVSFRAGMKVIVTIYRCACIVVQPMLLVCQTCYSWAIQPVPICCYQPFGQ